MVNDVECSRKVDIAIRQMTDEIADILGDNLAAVYLYGSYTLGDFRPGWSDLDILVLTEAEIPEEQAERLVGLRQEMSGESGDALYRCFEGGMLSLNSFVNGLSERVVYWGTSGQRIADSYVLDAFCRKELIEKALKKVVEPMGHEVRNYGMRNPDDAQLTYVQIGILAAVLLNSGAVDYVVTGCGTGEGAMLACNSFPGVICGHVEDPLDAYTFAQINDGNAIAIPFAKGFGWGGELNLEYIFEKLFGEPSGQGYPRDRAVPEQRNKRILDDVRAAAFKPLGEILRALDPELVKGALDRESVREHFFDDCKCDTLREMVREFLEG